MPCRRLFGFLFGSVLSGGAVYSYLVQEYKTSNDLLTEDIYVSLSVLSMWHTRVYPGSPDSTTEPATAAKLGLNNC